MNLGCPGCNREAMDDDELIANLAGGDDTALRELFTRHAPWLACLVFAAGLLAFTVRGARTSLADHG